MVCKWLLICDSRREKYHLYDRLRVGPSSIHLLLVKSLHLLTSSIPLFSNSDPPLFTYYCYKSNSPHEIDNLSTLKIPSHNSHNNPTIPVPPKTIQTLLLNFQFPSPQYPHYCYTSDPPSIHTLLLHLQLPHNSHTIAKLPIPPQFPHYCYTSTYLTILKLLLHSQSPTIPTLLLQFQTPNHNNHSTATLQNHTQIPHKNYTSNPPKIPTLKLYVQSPQQFPHYCNNSNPPHNYHTTATLPNPHN